MFDGFKRTMGILITVTPLIATFFGYDTSPNFVGDATQVVSGIIQAGGIALTIYGIVKAKGPMWFMKK